MVDLCQREDPSRRIGNRHRVAGRDGELRRRQLTHADQRVQTGRRTDRVIHDHREFHVGQGAAVRCEDRIGADELVLLRGCANRPAIRGNVPAVQRIPAGRRDFVGDTTKG